MLTIMCLIVDMWYYMFTGNSFLYYGDTGMMVIVYILVGGFISCVEISAISATIDTMDNSNGTQKKQK